MTKTILMATTALLLSAGTAAAQAAAPAPAALPAPAADPAQPGVLTFTPDFFAEARPNTAMDMLNRLPGFSANDGDGSRGFEGSVGNILFNGQRPASKSDSGTGVASRTQASDVERIELIRGGASGIAMQGYSVVANVVLKQQSSRQQIVSWNANLFDGARDLFGGSYQFTAREGDRSWGVTLNDGISMSDSGGPGRVIRTDAGGAVIRDEISDTRFGGGGSAIRGNYSGPMAGGTIEATARYGIHDWQQSQLQTAPDVRRESTNERDGTIGEVGLVYQRPLAPTWNLETRIMHEFETAEGASVSRTRLGGVDSPEQVFDYEYEASESILRGLLRNERSANLTLEGGAEVAYNVLDTAQAFTVGGAPVPLPSATVKVEEVRGELFGKSTWRMRPTLTLETGLRLETSTISQSGDAAQEKSLFFAKPRALLTWTPRPSDQLRFRFERELGQLDFNDFAASADLEDDNVFGGNVDLEPEQRWISELVYERRFWSDGIASLTLRHDEIIDAIDVIPLPLGLSATGNIGDGSMDQLAVSLVLPTENLGVPGGRLSVDSTWTQTEVIDPTTGEAREISGVRPWEASVGYEQDVAAWKTQFGINYMRGFDETTFDPDQRTDVRIRDYLVVFAEYKPTSTLSLRAQVNLWDDFLIERTAYADRTTRAIAFVEQRTTDPRTFYQLRLRKAF